MIYRFGRGFLLGTIGLAGLVNAQSQAAFESASVKTSRATDARGSIVASRGGELTIQSVPLKSIIQFAYDLQDYSYSGPRWTETAQYDIVAKTAAKVSDVELKRMLQTLLADRFKLSVRRETRMVPAYELVVAKDGPKLHESVATEASERSGTFGPAGQLNGARASMGMLAAELSKRLERPVLNATGLKGVYDFSLRYVPDQTPPQPRPLDEGEAQPPDSGRVGPSIFTAIQKQLGLKLEAKKSPIEVLVVERAEKVP